MQIQIVQGYVSDGDVYFVSIFSGIGNQEFAGMTKTLDEAYKMASDYTSTRKKN